MMDISFTIPDFWLGVIITVISVPILVYLGTMLVVAIMWKRG